VTWTYGGSPSTSTRDAVRFLSGQNSSADDQLVSDGEITYALAQRSSNVYGAAQTVCEVLAAKYASKASEKGIGQLSIVYGDRSRAFADKAKALGMQLIRQGVSPYVGGISEADKETDQNDTDLVQPSFAVGMDANRRRGNDTPST
jgi:hypothetical protein